MTVMRAHERTPAALMMVHSTMVIEPRMMPFSAPVDRQRVHIAVDDLEAAPDRRQHRLHGDGQRGDRHDVADQHEPAGEPADRVAREAS